MSSDVATRRPPPSPQEKRGKPYGEGREIDLLYVSAVEWRDSADEKCRIISVVCRERVFKFRHAKREGAEQWLRALTLARQLLLEGKLAGVIVAGSGADAVRKEQMPKYIEEFDSVTGEDGQPRKAEDSDHFFQVYNKFSEIFQEVTAEEEIEENEGKACFFSPAWSCVAVWQCGRGGRGGRRAGTAPERRPSA